MEHKTCYAVLWIPTFTHKSFIEHPIKETIRRNISDLVDEELEIIATLRKDKSIGISALGERGKKKGFLRLDYFDCSRNGLIEYSYKETHFSDVKSDGFQFTSEIFPEAIYHIIKEFYHVHEYHDHEADTPLPPYTSDKRVDLQQNDNPALQHYLERYETALTDLVVFARRAKEDIAEDSRKKKLKERIGSLWYNLIAIWEEAKKEKEFKKRIISCWSQGKNKCKNARKKRLLHYGSLGKIITKAKGYEIYLNALYGSIYNTKCKICACNNVEPAQTNPNRSIAVLPKDIQKQAIAATSEIPSANTKEIQGLTVAAASEIPSANPKGIQGQAVAAASESTSANPKEAQGQTIAATSEIPSASPKETQGQTVAATSEIPSANTKEIQGLTVAAASEIPSANPKGIQGQAVAISRENLSVIPIEDKKDDLQKDMRRRAFNIESLIKYFNACYQQYNQQNIIEQIKNERRATILAMGGIFITLLFGLFNPVSFFKDSSTDSQDKETEIIKAVNLKIDSLNAQIKDLTKAMSAQTGKSMNSVHGNAPKGQKH